MPQLNRIQELVLNGLNLKLNEPFEFQVIWYTYAVTLRFVLNGCDLEIEYYCDYYKKWDVADYDDYLLWHTIINCPELVKKVGNDNE